MEKLTLIKAAIESRKNAYAPYSGFSVGAAILCQNGQIYTGCNVENSAYGETLCAERVAFGKAISEGERSFVAIAIVGGKDSVDTPCMPCGSCRQVMAELCKKDFKIILKNGDGVAQYTLSELLPHAFGIEV